MKSWFTLILLCAGVAVSCSTETTGRPASKAADAVVTCPDLLPWFEYQREMAGSFGQAYDPRAAADQVISWLRDPEQIDRDLGGLAEVDFIDAQPWDTLTPAEQQASIDIVVDSATAEAC